jgi:hypothetical protein
MSEPDPWDDWETAADAQVRLSAYNFEIPIINGKY